MRWRPWYGWLVLLIGLSACGPLRYTVNNDAFSQLSVDKKMRLFDAENDVSLAQDEEGQMREAIHDLRMDQDQAERSLRLVQRQEGGNTQVAARMWNARLKYLQLALDYMHQRLRVQDTMVVASQARFELAKALIVKKNKMPGADKIVVKNFEKQADSFNERAKTELAALALVRNKVERARSDWLRLRDDVAANTLGGASQVGEEEQPAWQSW